MNENNEIRDAFMASLDMAREIGRDTMGMTGFGVLELRDGDLKIKSLTPFSNLITDAGDLYAASKIITGIGTPNAAAPTAANGMKLGTGTNAVHKVTANQANLQTYLSGSQQLFTLTDTTYPQISNLGSLLGVCVVYKITYAAGTATNSAITEAVIVNDAGSNATSTVPNTYSRTVFTAINKGASDSLAITWQWKQLGA